MHTRQIELPNTELAEMRLMAELAPVADQMPGVKMNYRKEMLDYAERLGRLLDLIAYPSGESHIVWPPHTAADAGESVK